MAHLDRLTDTFDAKERAVYDEMRRFESTNDHWLTRLKEQINQPLERWTKKLEKSVADEHIERASSAVAEQLEKVSTWSLDPDDVLEEYREAGHDLDDLDDIHTLDLRAIEGVVDGLEGKYRIVAAGEGAVTGAGGLGGALADLPAVAATAMRAIAEHGLYYGFQTGDEEDRHFAYLVLGAATSSGDARREALDRITDFTERLHGVRSSEESLPTPAVAEIAERFVLRLARGKLFQSLPVVGAAIGAGLDQRLLQSVCETARHCSRQRWMLRRHAGSEG